MAAYLVLHKVFQEQELIHNSIHSAGHHSAYNTAQSLLNSLNRASLIASSTKSQSNTFYGNRETRLIGSMHWTIWILQVVK